MRSFVAYIMRGRVHAMAISVLGAVLSLVVPIVSYLSAAVIALVTLRRGAMDGLFIVIGSALAFLLFALFTPVNPWVTVVFVFVAWVPVWALANVLRATVSLPKTINAAAVLGVLAVVVVYFRLDNVDVWWQDRLEALAQAAGEGGAASQDVLLQVFSAVVPYMTGALVAGVMLGLVTSLFLGRWWQALLYNPGGFRTEFRALRLERSFALAFIAAIALAVVAGGKFGGMAANIAVVLLSLYVLHGYALVHSVIALKGAHVGWLVAFYVLTLVILPQLLLLVAVVGFVDSWVDIRARLSKRGSPEDTHS
ncbi:MAG TPA: DUF2232 domain-containing protein [Gammaproteobacteria bacterium]|nr:DUF2232 domain-containing protein [Gammaproteobacteria bacterium]